MANCNCNQNNTTNDTVATNILQGVCVDGLLIRKPACCEEVNTCTYVPPCPPNPCPFSCRHCCRPFAIADSIGEDGGIVTGGIRTTEGSRHTGAVADKQSPRAGSPLAKAASIASLDKSNAFDEVITAINDIKAKLIAAGLM